MYADKEAVIEHIRSAMSKTTKERQTQNCTAPSEQENKFEYVKAAISQTMIPTHIRLNR